MVDNATGTSRRAVMVGAALLGLGSAQPLRAEAQPPLALELAFEATVDIADTQEEGVTPLGKRFRIPITGGSFQGPKIKGKVLPGGADWQLLRADGCLTLEADYMIQADDGTLIHVLNRGLLRDKPNFYLRTTPVFEAPLGPHDWLNKSVFVGSVDPLASGKAVVVRVWRVV